MKLNRWLIPTLLLVMLALGACAPSPKLSATASPAPSVEASAAVDASGCPAPAAGQALLKNDANGYCVVYPAEYSAEIPNFIVIHPYPPPGDIPGDAWVDFIVEPAAGRTAAQAADAEIADQVPGLNITRTETTVDGAPAIVVDGLSSFDSVRKVYIVMNDRLYVVWFMPWFPNASAPTLLDKLYDTVMGSLHFYPPA